MHNIVTIIQPKISIMLLRTNYSYALLTDKTLVKTSNVLTAILYFLQQSLQYIVQFAIPSFLSTSSTHSTPLHAIATLDGLRGYASLGVFTIHFTDTFCQAHNRGWGFSTQDHYLMQLPFIHYFWTAPALVATFFVISGYVLSYKPLKLIRTQNHESLLRTLSSSIFRRGIRLYVPVIIATFICFLFVIIGAFNYPHWVFEQHQWLAAGEDTPPIYTSVGAQFVDWWQSILDMAYLFRWGGMGPSYDPHLWTIPTEFQGSMLLFLVSLGLCNTKTMIRLSLIAALVIYCLWYGSNEIPLFFCGMFLAEIDMVIREQPKWEKYVLRRLKWVWFGLFVVGFYLVGMPSWDTAQTPGYKTIMWVHSNWFHWHMLGCVFLVFSIRNCDVVEALFTNRFAQYLGNISFSLYIVHGNVRRSVSYALMPTLVRVTNGDESKLGYAICVLVNLLITYPLVFWLADMWWRGIDIPSMKLARWLEEKAACKD
jgi:peptidoglycan/LPS O-acetylase OafA/YrhL